MPRAPRPNFLFLFPDQLRPDWIGPYASVPVRTPHLDSLAARGMTFLRAYTPSPLCAPARACLASGLSYERCGVKDNGVDYPLDQPTYYQRLREAGYRVGGVGKFDLHKATLDWGLDGSRLLDEWGFTDGIDNEGKLDGSISYTRFGAPKGPYLAHLASQGLADAYVAEHRDRKSHRDAYLTSLPEPSYCDNWLTANGLSILESFPKDTPWHLVVNFTGPHNPMDVTPGMAARWEGTGFPPPRDNHDAAFPAEAHQRNRRHYAAMIENIDARVGDFLALVARRGETDRTIVIFSSDHGEMLGDHGRWGKSQWYEESIRVPLVVSGPGMTRGARSEALVAIHDLCPTMVDYADARPLEAIDSASLRPLLEGERSAHRSYLPTALRDWRAVFDGRYKLVRQGDSTKLFDLESDPGEMQDIAAADAERVDRLAGLSESSSGLP